MSNEPTITITGNLTGDPELRFTPSGQAYARFVIAATPRRYDRTTNGWTDGETMFLRATAWRDLANHIAASLGKGARVIASGRLRQNNWTTDDGETRWSIDLEVDDLGPSLHWATATVTKATRDQAERADQRQPAAEGTPAGGDPWTATPAGGRAEPATAGAGAAGTPPF
ncbi:single-stranded DNA-binding protein [Microlunatus speluncae]|uniref:single-stranded DNA-binding protein n=1 Tax=Microlunatus speluncae TaxID=2594267 RepID=UPI0012665B1E|nr:single-stranded DNA-binding protein [Microlunatus speluncae]